MMVTFFGGRSGLGHAVLFILHWGLGKSPEAVSDDRMSGESDFSAGLVAARSYPHVLPKDRLSKPFRFTLALAIPAIVIEDRAGIIVRDGTRAPGAASSER